MIYENENIYMRPFERKDLSEKYRSWFHNSQVTRYNSHGLFPYTKERMEKFIKTIEDGGPDIIWAIFEKVNSDHIGNCSIQSINWINRSAEVAFVLGDPCYWGKGYGTAAGRFMLFHAFERMNLHRVWTGTAETNEGMRALAKKLGMTEEGRFKDGVFLNGVYTDVVMYSILQDRDFLLVP